MSNAIGCHCYYILQFFGGRKLHTLRLDKKTQMSTNPSDEPNDKTTVHNSLCPGSGAKELRRVVARASLGRCVIIWSGCVLMNYGLVFLNTMLRDADVGITMLQKGIPGSLLLFLLVLAMASQTRVIITEDAIYGSAGFLRRRNVRIKKCCQINEISRLWNARKLIFPAGVTIHDSESCSVYLSRMYLGDEAIGVIIDLIASRTRNA